MLRLSILGDHGNEYTIEIDIDAQGKGKLSCSCPATLGASICKHRLELLQGNYKRINLEEEAYKAFVDLISHPYFVGISEKYLAPLIELENQLKRIKKETKDYKIALGKELE